MTVDIPVPIKLISPNTREHWAKAYKRHKLQKEITQFALKVYDADQLASFPIEVTLIRKGRGKLDDDNLAFAFKHIRDAVADFLIPGLLPGRSDGDDRIRWKYEQISGPPSIIINITPLE